MRCNTTMKAKKSFVSWVFSSTKRLFFMVTWIQYNFTVSFNNKKKRENIMKEKEETGIKTKKNSPCGRTICD